MRVLIHLFGLACIAIGLLLGLFALLGWLVSDDRVGRVVAGVLGGLALLVFMIGVRAYRHGRRNALVVPKGATEAGSRVRTGLHYEDFKWGDPPPSQKQFGYAMSLGVEVRDGMTKWMLSDAIDEAIEEQRSGEPATNEQLRTINNYHGVLPRAVTRGEAKRIIELLEDYHLPCPFCGIEVFATDYACCACGKRLNRMKIPIIL